MSLKKNQLNRVPFAMVDKTDFATIERGLDAADISVDLWGLAHGTSTAASAITVSKVPELVYSGLFNLTLKATETDAHDAFILRLSSTSTVSCADQTLILNMEDVTRSDIHSMLSDLLSDFQSRVPKAVATQSLLSDVNSDLASQIGALPTGVAASDMSDIASRVRVLFDSDVSDIISGISNLQSRVTKEVASKSLLSDVNSDLASQIAGITASVGASDMSDIASRVGVVLASDISDIISALSNLQSRVPKEAASKSLLSDVHSDLTSQIGDIGTGTVTASDISDIASRVEVVLASDLSDILSALSNLQSRVPKEAASKSLLSDVRSDLTSQIGGITASVSASDISDIASAVEATQASRLSDILSAAQEGSSRALVIQSNVSDILVDTAEIGAGGAGLTAVLDTVEHQRGKHTVQGSIFYVDPVNGDTHANGNRGGRSDPYSLVQDCHDNAVTDSAHDLIILLSGAAAGATTLTEAVTLSKRYLQIRGPGRDFIWTRSGAGDTITVTADGIGLSGFRLRTAASGAGNGLTATSADFLRLSDIWAIETRGDAFELTDCDNAVIERCTLQATGQSGSGHGIQILAGSGETGNYGHVLDCDIEDIAGDGIQIDTTGGGAILDFQVGRTIIQGCTDDGVDIVDSGAVDTIIHDNIFGNNTSNDIEDAGTNTVAVNNEQHAKHSIATETRLAELDSGNLPSAVDAIDSQLTVTDASVSNILSRVPAVVGSSAVQSDIYSLLAARVTKEVASKSLLSDVESNVRSQIAILPTSAVQSDIYSLLSDVSSRTLTAATIATEVLDQAAGVETGMTVRQTLKTILAASAGILAGAATNTITIRNTADDTDRITATVDADGNRTSVVLDVT